MSCGNVYAVTSNGYLSYTGDYDVALWMHKNTDHEVYTCTNREINMLANSNVGRVRCLDVNRDRDNSSNTRDIVDYDKKAEILWYVKHGTVVCHMDRKHPWMGFMGLSCNNTYPVIVYNHKEDSYITRYPASVLNKQMLPANMQISHDHVALFMMISKSQPNKETSVAYRVIIDVDFEAGTITIPWSHSYNHNIYALATDVALHCGHDPSFPVLCTEVSTKCCFLIPDMAMRSDTMTYIVMIDDSIRPIVVQEESVYACEPTCRLSTTVEGVRYGISIKNNIMESLTLSKKLGIKYHSKYISLTTTPITVYHHTLVIRDQIDKLIRTYASKSSSVSDCIDSCIRGSEYLYHVRISDDTRIKRYRSQVPELFVQRYTRESPLIPEIIGEDEVQKYTDMGRSIIRYPRTGQYARFYMAPIGKYVGLKPNRLHNAAIFPYIVTCYGTDHSSNPSTHTYRYLLGEDWYKKGRSDDYVAKVKGLGEWQHGSVPEYIMGLLQRSKYKAMRRVGMPKSIKDFVISLSSSAKYAQFKDFHIAKQELWYLSVEEIEDKWRSCNNYDSLFDMYRIVECIIGADIVVTAQRGDEVIVELPHCPQPYIWKKSYNRAMIVAHTRINEYQTLYEIITSIDGNIFTLPGEDLYTCVMDAKERCTRYSMHMDMYGIEVEDMDISRQVIGDKGKVVLVMTPDGCIHDCYTRPLQRVPYVIVDEMESVIARYAQEHDDKLHVRIKDIRGCITLTQ